MLRWKPEQRKKGAKPKKLRAERPERREEGRGPKKGREEEEEKLRRRPERKEGAEPGAAGGDTRAEGEG